MRWSFHSPRLRVAVLLAVAAILALLAVAPASGDLEQGDPDMVIPVSFGHEVGCPLPANVPEDVADSLPFQRDRWRYTVRSYPECAPNSTAYAQALAQVQHMPRAAQSGGVSGDGMGETAWTSIGPTGIRSDAYSTVSGHVEALAVDPTAPSTLYAAGSSGGVWKSTDGGQTWTSPAANEVVPAIGALAIDPNHHNVLYAGTGYGVYGIHGDGLLKSVDGGQTWSALGTSDTFGWWPGFRRILVDPADTTGNTVWAATSNGLYRSTDGGASWTLLSTGATNPQYNLPYNLPVWDIALDPTNHSTIFAAVGENLQTNPATGIYKSVDGGATWHLLANGPNGDASTAGGNANTGLIRLAVADDSAATSGFILYATAENASDSTLLGAWSSVDGGVHWTELANPDPSSGPQPGKQWWYDDVLAVDPSDSTGQTLWAGGINLFKSTDGGAVWSQVTDVYGNNTQHMHPDQHAIAFSGSTVYVGNDGGVYKSADGGATWSSLNSTLDITEFYSAASGPASNPIVVGGAQDNGVDLWSGFGSGTGWNMIFGGDGGATAIDPTNPETIYEEYINLNMYKSTDGGSTWNAITKGITDLNRACFIAPFQLDQSHPNHLIAATDRVYESTDGGANWTAISSDLTGGGGCITALAMAPSDPFNTIYAAASSAKIWRTSNRGKSWTNITGEVPSYWKSSIAVDPRNPLVAAITGSWCFSPSCVWRTTNGGASWTNITGNLPGYNTNAVLIDPQDSSHIYVGGDIGVFETFDGGQTWTQLGSGMPIAEVDALSLSPDGTILTAGSYGRGMYQLHRSWVTPNATRAAVGDTVTLGGHGFIQNERVSVSVDGTSQTPVTADAQGNVTVAIAAPAAGTHTVLLSGSTSHRSASSSLVTAAPSTSESVAAGWNLLDVPVQSASLGTASGYAGSVNVSLGAGAVHMLATYASGHFQVYLPGYTRDFALNPGQGIALLSGSSGTWKWPAGAAEPAQAIALQPGWNLVAAPSLRAGVNSDTVANEIGPAVTELVASVNGTYQTYQPAVSSPFLINAGQAMWILCNSPATWTPR